MLDDALGAAVGLLGWAVADDAAGAAVVPFELKLLEQAVAARAIPAAQAAAAIRFLIGCSLVTLHPGAPFPRRPPDAFWSLTPDYVRRAGPVQRYNVLRRRRIREVTMAVIVVTRLRLKDPALLDAFFTDALAAIEQAQTSDGNLGVDALADANNAWWSVTAWQERRLMQSYVRTEPHRSIQSHLDRYCDEATFVDWEQDSPDLPDWPTNWRHLVADGQAAELTQPSAAHQTRDFPAPVVAPPAG